MLDNSVGDMIGSDFGDFEMESQLATTNHHGGMGSLRYKPVAILHATFKMVVIQLSILNYIVILTFIAHHEHIP